MDTKARSAEPLAGRRILVVDDEEDVRIYITTLLEDHGAETLEARDGEEAIAVARSERPDLITLDLSMPGVDGTEAFKSLRRDPELEQTPICIITGHPELRRLIYERADSRPPEGYLNKPVDAATLLRNVRKILEVGKKSRKS